MSFVEKLETLCRERGLSERALARAIGINQSTISLWRLRGGLPRPEISKKIADYFETSVHDLLDESKGIPERFGGTRLMDSDERKRFRDLPEGVKRFASEPVTAWGHYLALEYLFDTLLKSRRAPLSDEEEREFQHMLRQFMRKRIRGRWLIAQAVQIWRGITGEIVQSLIDADAKPGPPRTAKERSMKRPPD